MKLISADKLYTDGGVKNNGHPNARGRICCASKLGVRFDYPFRLDRKIKILKGMANNEGYRYPSITSNTAELAALLVAMRKHDTKNITISTDSTLAMNLVNLNWRSKEPAHALLVLECIKLMKEKNIKVIHETRENNLAGKYLERKYRI